MSEDSFAGGKPELKGEIPPIIDDPKTANTIESTSESASNFIQNLASSNFFVGILLGASM